MELLVVMSGPIGSGKTRFAEALAAYGARSVSTRSYIRERTGCGEGRIELQAAGAALDEETGGLWVVDAVVAADAGGGDFLLLDSARIVSQVEGLRERFPGKVVHAHLEASPVVLEARYRSRPTVTREYASYEEASAHGTERQVGTLAGIADLVFDTEDTDPYDLALATMAFVGKLPPTRPLVDVIVGGQYGSEGKGNVCASIASRYDGLLRIGGPNAGHRVADPSYKYVQLPSGSMSNMGSQIIIAAGSTVWLPQLMLEILDHGLTGERLTIDPQVMVIDDDDRRIEGGSGEGDALTAIATTKQGVGAAVARKVLNRGKPLFGSPVILARDVPQLERFVRPARVVVDRLLREGKPILVEGTQGTELSIHHGRYPHVTSRETTSSGCISDAGIPPGAVRDVIMVLRTYPIRVGGPSGPMGREIDFATVSGRCGLPVDEIARTERGTVSNRERRIAEFDWGRLRREAELNGATCIALTFADYIDCANRDASCFGDLSAETQDFIRKVERVAGVPVTLVSKAFAKDGILERGDWS
ncbi:MAG: adenylosuccinate synthetase [Erythrobacter sp.]|nr:MAG: adenylosuccinate synthetase [Erythrobacter sp.]